MLPKVWATGSGHGAVAVALVSCGRWARIILDAISNAVFTFDFKCIFLLNEGPYRCKGLATDDVMPFALSSFSHLFCLCIHLYFAHIRIAQSMVSKQKKRKNMQYAARVVLCT